MKLNDELKRIRARCKRAIDSSKNTSWMVCLMKTKLDINKYFDITPSSDIYYEVYKHMQELLVEDIHTRRQLANIYSYLTKIMKSKE